MSVAVRRPAPDGVKDTWNMQVPPPLVPAARVWPEHPSLRIVKSEGFASPPTDKVSITVAKSPMFETITVTGVGKVVPTRVAGNVTVCGLKPMTDARPEPESDATDWLEPSLNPTVTAAPLKVPIVVGAKTTEISQVPSAGIVAGSAPQVLVWVKTPPFAPMTLIAVIVKEAPPLFWICTDSGLLEVPSG